MSIKNIIKIINEEIGGFDFLENEKYLKEQETIDLLNDEDFQKQFICDSLLNPNKIKSKVTSASIGGNWEENPEDASSLSVEYFLNIIYKYDQTKEPISFNLDFYSDKIKISKYGRYNAGSYDVEPSGEAWLNDLEWHDIDVNLSTIDGDDISFEAFKKAPDKIRMLFNREYTSDFISNEINMEIRTPEMKEKVQNTQYC